MLVRKVLVVGVWLIRIVLGVMFLATVVFGWEVAASWQEVKQLGGLRHQQEAGFTR